MRIQQACVYKDTTPLDTLRHGESFTFSITEGNMTRKSAPHMVVNNPYGEEDWDEMFVVDLNTGDVCRAQCTFLVTPTPATVVLP